MTTRYVAGEHKSVSVGEVVAELLQPTRTTETIERFEQRPTPAGGQRWRKVRKRVEVEHPPLLVQLSAATSSPTMQAGDSYRSVPQSKPSARLDALAVLQRIDVESKQWAQVLGTRSRVPVTSRLRGLVGGEPAARRRRLRDDAGRTLQQATRSWLAAARVVTGWDSPPYTPPVPCPEASCERRGTIRVRFDSHTASCLECGTWWTDGQLHVLGEYVRWSAEHLTGPDHLVVQVVDGVEQLVRCAECEDVRREMAERRDARLAGARHAAAVTAR